MPIVIDTFGRLRDGGEVRRATLSVDGGIAVEVIEYGARLRAIDVPGRDGRRVPVVLGHATVAGYEDDGAYMGAVVGRCANRTAVTAATPYPLSRNDGAHHLHGGETGLSRSPWRIVAHDGGDAPRVRLEHRSPDGEDGYPGALDLAMEIVIDTPMSLHVLLTASGDAATPVSLTTHPYFNLSGDAARPIDDHDLRLDAGEMLEVDRDQIPTGRRLPVAGTPFDFTRPTRIGARIGADDPQLRLAGGYDHYWIGDRGREGGGVGATLSCPLSGLSMRLESNQPGLQFYSGNHLRNASGGRAGLCLEPHNFPDAINNPAFPDPLLRPGDVYRHAMRLAFAR